MRSYNSKMDSGCWFLPLGCLHNSIDRLPRSIFESWSPDMGVQSWHRSDMKCNLLELWNRNVKLTNSYFKECGLVYIDYCDICVYRLLCYLKIVSYNSNMNGMVHYTIIMWCNMYVYVSCNHDETQIKDETSHPDPSCLHILNFVLYSLFCLTLLCLSRTVR